MSDSGFVLNEDVALGCQLALFKTGDDRNIAEFYETAGHQAFVSGKINSIKALR